MGTSPRNIREGVEEAAVEDNNRDIEVEDRDGKVEAVAGSVDRVDSVCLVVIEADYSVMVVLEVRGSLVPFVPFAPFP